MGVLGRRIVDANLSPPAQAMSNKPADGKLAPERGAQQPRVPQGAPAHVRRIGWLSRAQSLFDGKD